MSTELRARPFAVDIPAGRAATWHPRLPELAAAANAVSLLLPAVEPSIAKSIRAKVDDLDDPDLRARTKEYVRQELAHHAQHRRFNDSLAVEAPGTRRVERWARAYVGWIERRGPRFGVAFAAASEGMAFGIARWIDGRVALLDGADPDVAGLLLWHLAEEVEHKSAAHDVFEATDGSRLRYAAAVAVTLVLLLTIGTAATIVGLKAAGRLVSPVAWFRLLGWAVSLAWTVLPTLATSCLPGQSPHDLVDPPYLTQWLRGLDGRPI